jgi:hypothetical protein
MTANGSLESPVRMQEDAANTQPRCLPSTSLTRCQYVRVLERLFMYCIHFCDSKVDVYIYSEELRDNRAEEADIILEKVLVV